ncbi:MAG: PDZ domain-containing protein [Acidobacteria bacterium]|nr:MAG: PDZ domain-containing protein [Acidobacteriota bacterium]TDI42863.1 MAG: PDZ domain-containing protein [Acidobacteriota bacterium]
MTHRHLAPALILALAVAPALAGDEARIMKAFRKAGPSVVPIHYTLRLLEAPEGGQGNKVEGVLCGVVAGPDGLIVTTADVFPDPGGDPRQTFMPSKFIIKIAGQEFTAQAVGQDRERNLAFLKVDDPASFPAPQARFTSRSPRPGERVLLLGLLGALHEHAPTFTEARIVSSLPGKGPRFALDALVQDLTIGGLVVNMKGEGLGIIGEDLLRSSPAGTADLAAAGNVLSLFSSLSQGQRPGYPVLFPYSGLLDVLIASPPALNLDPTERRGWLGIIMQPLTRDLADYWQVPGPGGVIIGSVLDGSPAEEAGLQVGDIILEVDDAPVRVRELRDLTRFRKLVQRVGAGEEVPLAIFRAGERQIIPLTLGARPKNVFLAEQQEESDFGLTVKELTFDFVQATNTPREVTGVFVAEIKNAGWADVAGVRVNDVITAVHGQKVDNLQEFRQAMGQVREKHPETVVFFVRRGMRTRFVPINPDW